MKRLNYGMLLYTLGIICLVEAAFMCIPFIISLAYADNLRLGFGVTIAILVCLGVPFVIRKPIERHMVAKDGFVIVTLAWILMSITGTIPYLLSGTFTNFFDALFESVSAFTTTGAYIGGEELLQSMPRSLILWRSLSQWMGGMGVLVFVIAILPKADPEIIHLFRAEMPGPQVGKIVSKLRTSARILYCIYVGLTLLQMALLCIKMPFFDSVVTALSTASTGGFALTQNSLAVYGSNYPIIVTTIFMYLFSINFNAFFLILIGRIKDVLLDEEFLTFTGFVVAAMFIIALDLRFNGDYSSFGLSVRDAAFYTTSIISTSGFSIVNYNSWPVLSKTVIMILTIVGGCAGSTAGGFKVSRVIIVVKDGIQEIKMSTNPHTMYMIRYNRKALDKSVSHGTQRYALLYCMIFFASTLLVSIYNPNYSGLEFSDVFNAVASCFNNVGLTLGSIGENGYGNLSFFSKFILSIDMLAGRLEILPLAILFVPKTWR